ncbi:hypothetical protein LCGC14_1652880, partial [marine sediment metagenome]
MGKSKGGKRSRLLKRLDSELRPHVNLVATAVGAVLSGLDLYLRILVEE